MIKPRRPICLQDGVRAKTIEDKKSGKCGGKGGKTEKGKKRAGDIDLEELDLNKDERKLAEAALNKK